jgi:hypothetical protein
MQLLQLHIEGRGPLLMQADTLADPLNPKSIAHKALTGKKKKTEEDHVAIARSEYIASLYWRKDVGVHIPGQNFDGSFRAAAAMHRQRVNWDRGCIVIDDHAPLIYDGPKTPEALWADRDFVDARAVVVRNQRVIRYRPIFREWACDVALQFDPEIMSESEIVKILNDAGRYTHLCTFRRRFGRFAVSVK